MSVVLCASHCDTLRHTATHGVHTRETAVCCIYIATRRIATHVLSCVQHAATRWTTLQHTSYALCVLCVTRCNMLQHAAIYCKTLQHTATHIACLVLCATRCNTLQHAATRCNTPHETTLSLACTLQYICSCVIDQRDNQRENTTEDCEDCSVCIHV